MREDLLSDRGAVTALNPQTMDPLDSPCVSLFSVKGHIARSTVPSHGSKGQESCRAAVVRPLPVRDQTGVCGQAARIPFDVASFPIALLGCNEHRAVMEHVA